MRLPSLESRATDIPALTRHFLHAESGDPLLELTPEVEAYLVRRHYPGNVRDLKQLVARICCRHVGPGPVTVGDRNNVEYRARFPGVVRMGSPLAAVLTQLWNSRYNASAETGWIGNRGGYGGRGVPVSTTVDTCPPTV